MDKNFNIVMVGTGGQGIITIARILARAAHLSGYEAKLVETHGLAQRGGQAWCHVRFGKKVYSPIIRQGSADLVISLEPLETLRSLNYLSKKSQIVVNDHPIIPVSCQTDHKKYPTKPEIKKILNYFTKKVHFRDIFSELQGNFQTSVPLNIALIASAFKSKALPIKKEKLLLAIKEVLKPEFFALNKKVFEFFSK